MNPGSSTRPSELRWFMKTTHPLFECASFHEIALHDPAIPVSRPDEVARSVTDRDSSSKMNIMFDRFL